jgi:RNA polymerase sigma-70 factor (ECF subfamily)
MTQTRLPLDASSFASTSNVAADEDRLRRLVDAHYDFIWRSLRRLGVSPGEVDDGVQQVFMTAARKLAAIRQGCERSYLFQTALRVASDHRRSRRRRPEVPLEGPHEEIVDTLPDASTLLELRRARQRLDEILDEMPLDLRVVFVLFELDEMTAAEIATLLELPAGTVASRLRRAKAFFSARANADACRKDHQGAP